jgi:hypothetical protein
VVVVVVWCGLGFVGGVAFYEAFLGVEFSDVGECFLLFLVCLSQ